MAAAGGQYPLPPHYLLYQFSTRGNNLGGATLQQAVGDVIDWLLRSKGIPELQFMTLSKRAFIPAPGQANGGQATENALVGVMNDTQTMHATIFQEVMGQLQTAGPGGRDITGIWGSLRDGAAANLFAAQPAGPLNDDMIRVTPTAQRFALVLSLAETSYQRLASFIRMRYPIANLFDVHLQRGITGEAHFSGSLGMA